jgi:hypothetical protein
MPRAADDDFGELDDRLDLSPLARAATWGGMAVVAALIVVLAAHSEPGAQRLAAAFNMLTGHPTPAPTAQTAAQAEGQRLAQAVRMLTADRDRLAARLDAIERNLDQTGSISTPATAPRADAQEPSRLTHAEFGLDLGTETSIEALRGLWNTVKAQHGAVLDYLRPLVMIRDGNGGSFELRLIAGPLANPATAARFCAVISATGRACRPAAFEGQRLALH